MLNTPFNQAPPELGNQFEDDHALRSCLERMIPNDVLRQMEPELMRMGSLAGGELYLKQLADRSNEPCLTQWDPWGERVDHIEVSPLWKQAERLAAEMGVVATAYERQHGALSRIHQFALAYLFSPSTDFYTCPLAMTDGTAHTLIKSKNRELIDRAVPHLTSRDPGQFWTSGQWMTEATGGSDVGTSETIARLDGGEWRLYGRKWFTSATTSETALTLGRPEGNGAGGNGLAMFYVELRDQQGRLRDIEVNRLKDKLGTRKVPTAEIMLRGTRAHLVDKTTGGVRSITPLLNITRTWNTVVSASMMRRGIALARDYARRRVAFGAALSDKPLHIDTLASLQAELEGAVQLSLLLAMLLGKEEQGELSDDEQSLHRLVTPLAKLTTGKQAVAVTSEVLECFGGAGYVEDTGLPTLLRDAQVLPIWEGTTNVLALDALRAIHKDPNSLEALMREAEMCAALAEHPTLVAAGRQANRALQRAAAWLSGLGTSHADEVERGARRFALTLGRAFELALLVRHGQWALNTQGDRRPAAAAQRFAATQIDLIQSAPMEDQPLLALT